LRLRAGEQVRPRPAPEQGASAAGGPIAGDLPSPGNRNEVWQPVGKSRSPRAPMWLPGAEYTHA